MKKIMLKVLALGLFIAPVGANAATIDFSGVQGDNPSPLVLPEVTISNTSGGSILVGAGAAGEADGFCLLAGGCDQDGEMLFSSPVSNLSFDIDGWGSGDFVEISAFNGPSLVGTLNAIANGNLDFSSFGTITRLVFDDSSTASGVGYSTFQFDMAAAVPPAQSVPSSSISSRLLLILALLGLGGVAITRRFT